jgi:hypothetical protein
MRARRTIALLITLGLVTAAAILAARWLRRKRTPITLAGAVIAQAADPARRIPIAGVQITAANDLAAHETKSDSAGLFHLKLRRTVRLGQPVPLKFAHPDYQPLTVSEPAGQQLYVVRMTPSTQPPLAPTGPLVNISVVTVRYTVRSVNPVSIGSAVRTLQVANQANIPCADASPCSPDGKWKAALASMSLDAGADNEFRDAKASCIAGPCPFTKIDSEQLSPDGRTLKVAVRNWSDTATFLIQAEVFRKMSEDVVRDLYPVIFGTEMNFTLPGEAEGPSIHAEVNGAAILFPLGPDLCLTWADCQVRVEQDQKHIYRCQLKPGYKFH